MVARFAKAYVDGGLDRTSVLELVAKAVNGSIDGWTIEASGIEIDVDRNENICRGPAKVESDDFIYFPLALDIEAVSDSVDLDKFLRVISSLMEGLHSKGIRVVVACEWESRLPGRGRLGYERHSG